jgi:hypothetical protein
MPRIAGTRECGRPARRLPGSDLLTRLTEAGVPRLLLVAATLLAVDVLDTPVGPVLTGFLAVPAGTTSIMWTTATVLLSVIACLVVPQVSTFGRTGVVAEPGP